MKDLYIVGAGGFGRDILWLTERINSVTPIWQVKGFIDDSEKMQGKAPGGCPVLGGCDYFEGLSQEVWVVVAIGSAKTRRSIVEKLSRYDGLHFATLIDPSVILSDRVRIGEGCMICAGTILTVDISIGNHVIINLDCTLGHDDVLEDYVTLYPSVNVSGCVTVGQETELGTGMQIIQGIRIGGQSILGAGTVVIKDIPQSCTAVGNPARIVRYH